MWLYSRYCKVPMYVGELGVSFLFPDSYFFLQLVNRIDMSGQTLPGKNVQFYFGHIQPAAMFRGIVNLQPPCQTVCLLRLELLVKRALGMGVQIIHDDNNCFRFRVHDIVNVLDFFCPINGSASLAYGNMLTTSQWFYYGEYAACAITFIFRIFF